MDSKKQRVALSLWALVLPFVLACGSSSQESSSSSPGSTAEGQLPPGHPSSDPSSPGMVVPPPPGSGTGSSGLAWTAPEGWLKEVPTSKMRRAQYRVPGEAGDGECVVFYFGPGQGGDARSNTIRWGEQFIQPDGRPSSAVQKSENLTVNGIPILLTEVTGTYQGGFVMDGSAKSYPGSMLLGAVAEGPDANWFFKLTGPEATVKTHREAFMTLIRSLRSAQ